jgi:hypothetical protein
MSIRLRFVAGNDLYSAIIRRAQMGAVPWSHVEAVTPEGTYLGSVTPNGVQARPQNYDSGQWTQELFVDVPATQPQSDAFFGFLSGQIGQPYDSGAIQAMAEGTLTGIDPTSTGRGWICSGLQSAALLASGIIKSLPMASNLMTPLEVLSVCGAIASIGTPQSAP